MKTRHSFTLIELLIVVAIIAILAAIAVPNFLEAQTRSKVSRAWSDMREIAGGVTAYAVDHNHLPLDGDDADVPGSIPYDQKAWFPRLTTPIAYMTSVPNDPFHTIKHPPDMMTDILFPGDPLFPYAYLTEGGFYPNPMRPSQPVHAGRPSKYGITSLGPNRIFDSARELGIDDIYDSSNGTVSVGDLVRYGP
ncbi:prepilin-type N-terminal cleavage/methylation domain-containing protein [Candidatus Sumerlaeota bacterium]|nr:prepilin-type N-terminal cleavage/methylation domain-containing protein [Candidatus Sumerlaeota bacterium]